MTINDAAGVEDILLLEDIDKVEQVEEKQGFRFSLPEWVWIKRSNEPVEKYIEHPFNFKKSEGVAYIIRGFSVIGGELIDYWWTDVLGGILRLRTEGKGDK